MRTWPIGAKVWVTGNCNDHAYVVGKPYVVVEIDDDGTFRGRDPETGVTGNWLRWQDVDIRPPIGWAYCQQVLPPEVIHFLSAFDGIESIVLRDDVKHRLLSRMPGLFQAIVAAQTEVTEERPEAGELPSRPAPRTDDPILRFFQGVEDGEEGELLS